MIVPKEVAAIPPSPVTLEKIVIVEGVTGLHIFEAVAKHLGLSDQIEIRDFGGIKDLSLFLRTLAATASFRSKAKSLGIVRDAENDADAARKSIKQAVQVAKLPTGVGVKELILPPGEKTGMIEGILVKSLEGNPVLECAEQFLACAKLQVDSHIRPKHLIHVCVGINHYKKMFSGIAAYNGLYPFDHAAFQSIISFIKSL